MNTPLPLRFVALLAAMACHSTAAAQPLDVRIEVSGVRSAKGKVLVALYDDRTAFPSRWDRAAARASVPAASGSVALTLRLPAAGRFAVIVVHDEDDDGRMSKNFVGFPKEGYVTGRNARTLEFPSFDAAQIDFSRATDVSLRLVYP